MKNLLLVVAGTWLAGCGPRTPPAAPVTMTLADVCAEPRSEERPPLLTEVVPEEVTAWLVPLLAPVANAAEARARAEAAVASFRTLDDSATVSSMGIGGMVLLYLQLLEAAYLLEGFWPEGAATPPADLAPLLEPIYDGLRLPAIFAGGFVQQLGGIVAQLLANADAPGEVLLAVMQLLRILPDRARVLHRHVALPLACDPSAHPQAALDALRHLADAGQEIGAYAEALALRREAARRSPDNVDDLYSLALAAYRAGQVEEGDRATGQADARCDETCTDRPPDLDRCAEAGAVIARLPQPADVEERLELARAFVTVGRSDEAKSLYEEAAEELPDDARPRTGLARLAMTEALDVASALPLLDSAGPDNRDGEYYELLVACRAMAAMYIVLPQIAEQPERAAELLAPTVASLHEATVAYLEFQPARASAILVLLEAAESGLAGGASDPASAAGEALGRVASRALPLAERYPDSPEVARLLVSAALFAPTAEEAFASLERALPGDLARDVTITTRRATLFLHAVLRWNAPERLASAAAVIDQIPAGTGDTWKTLLHADLLAARWRMGLDGVSPETVRDAYAALADDEKLDPKHRPRVLNNLAIVLAALGDSGAAAERLRRAEDLSDQDDDIPYFNRVALAALAPSPAPEALEGLRITMTDSSAEEQPSTLRRQALHWLAWLADREGRAADAAGLRTQADALEVSPFFPAPEVSDRGFMSRGDFQFGLGYSGIEGLIINLDTSSWLWLLVVPPA